MAHFGLNNLDIQNIFEKNVTVSSGPIKCLTQSNDNGVKFVVAVSKQIKSKAKKNLIKRQIRSLVLVNERKWQK
ncbi:MAG: hypothetical protein QJQ54_01920 [Mollicutes bacterium]|nr:MAG: hypothetical protein QJQ54_01920 [Mollicutes bacterium]